MTVAKATEAMKEEILTRGVSGLKGKGIVATVVGINFVTKTATVSIQIVGEHGVALVDVATTRLGEGDSMTVMEIDEAFTFTLE